jgi:hypothetical protein
LKFRLVSILGFIKGDVKFAFGRLSTKDRNLSSKLLQAKLVVIAKTSVASCVNNEPKSG